MKKSLILATALTLAPSLALAVPFQAVRIGDKDGFGYGAAAGLLGADGAAAKRTGGIVLGAGDLLPDLNTDGGTLTGSRDDFDNRSGETVSCLGCVDTGTTGVVFTDISLSTSYDASSAASDVYNHNTGTRGVGGAFPMPPSGTLTNQPGFLFDFDVALADANPAGNVFFNMVFGDYDVSPASVRITRANGNVSIVPVSVQAPNKDGLIQAAFSTLTFADVFTLNGAGTIYEGFLEVDFVAPSEPYTAFDYVELSVRQIDPNPAPAPGTLLLLAIGLLGLGWRRAR